MVPSKRKWLVIGSIAGAVVLVVAGAAVYLLRSLDGIVARAIERHGSEALGTRVTVGAVHLSPRTGEGVIETLAVANPPGYSKASAISIGKVTLRLEVGTLASNPVVVREVLIEAPRVRYEVDAAARANLDVIKANAQRRPAEASDAEATRLVVRTLTASDGSIDADATAVGGTSETLKLDTLRLTNLGGNDGAPPDVVAHELASAIQKAVSRAVAREGIVRARGEALRRGREKLKSLFK
jgi:uncharacterized protein involved in outer membrane biogenesis